jgi:hypothetical protein
MPSSGVVIIQLFLIYMQINSLQGQSQKQRNIDTINYITDPQKPIYNSQRASLGNSTVEDLLFPPYTAKKSKGL